MKMIHIITEEEEDNDPFPCRPTIRGQKEKQKENEKEKQQTRKNILKPNIESNPDIENPLRNQSKYNGRKRNY